MAFGIYCHIPFCLQRCRYCDFATVDISRPDTRPTAYLSPDEYHQLLLTEIQSRNAFFPEREVSSIYFGGGTPSLVSATFIVEVINEIAKCGFNLSADCEITVEMNPATVDQEKLEIYRDGGVNRISVGMQTLNDELLQACGRRHSAADTCLTLDLLSSAEMNFSVDLLFGLPNQTLGQVEEDLRRIEAWPIKHVSAYCLTVPESHPMAKNRAPESHQVEMFETISQAMAMRGLEAYEISNYAVPGYESRHNCIYWSGEPYWGIGLSSHSYLPNGSHAPFGLRFWNPKTFNDWSSQVVEGIPEWRFSALPAQQKEALLAHEALTDYCYIFLRTSKGLSLEALQKIFGKVAAQNVRNRLFHLAASGLILMDGATARLSRSGVMVSNQIFAELTFEESDLVPQSPN